MKNNYDKVMEEQLKKAVQTAVRQLLKNIENEPTLIVESGDGESNVSEETIADIRAWLFERR